ncbi:ATP synthase F0 subunit A [candidate division CPR3 bacterium GWF2_35_18]|uniref:ATP synthase subunit a n=1 Tax=candidate division CPR3 bacterium GW2011_GWF2_35_18 TaxID=1618350 RepID=A0A0G0BL38_UNCC3|nr:MAG: ATP synthase subunit a [candidate division CPR3 bacterium GW2011_GWF2_35_18]KKP86342.1 MAG: ATP synthase subunit a [candidate division CPR3 bacterium GW2011_GWE2_35_7]OGB63419.1 MAG: ATP synthase F0 subunit A [candidate division CPR3 bacterium GWF2_35_18]OGB64836.1 MAG: ATP synthase F0 subunit A [candidate division CPR3 bacterium RIFOXYA2_FULL_35_13]OGB76953.1 MAG: ATP synthase F0 subunit A [candidate division CPR3 bacterium RIFOXYC2_FULL_35_7]OGB78993.1 MAG: ATP synthase F0 subunit A 
MHVSVAAETLFKIGSFPITNSLLTTIIVTLLLILLAVVVNKNVSKIPSRLQSMMEIMIGALLGLTEDVAGKEFGRKIFPLLATFFIFIIFANWSGLIPGVGSIGFYETKEEAVVLEETNSVYAETHSNTEASDSESDILVTETAESHDSESEIFKPLFRGPTADLNTTLALALISVFMIQFYGFKTLGLKYLKKFFNFRNPINGFIGILELLSEFSRIISFAFRLFGNIFAGEVLLTVIAYLIPFIAPLPFIGLEIFVGFIQALVFMMLSLVFISMATISEH